MIQAAAHAGADTEALLLRDDHERVATLRLNRPRQYNALSEALLDALQNELDAIAEDEEVRVVILAGTGKAFCAGHDLKEMRAGAGRATDEERHRETFGRCSRMMMSIIGLPQPVIARVHGTATAAGCQLVAMCDLAVASSEARFAVSGVDLGLFCSTPGVALGRNLGRKRSMEMLLSGRFISAAEALEYGLINRVAEPQHLEGATLELARTIAAKPRDAVRLGKRLFYSQIEKSMADAYREASAVMACNMLYGDTLEGIDAFIEKRKPAWAAGSESKAHHAGASRRM